MAGNRVTQLFLDDFDAPSPGVADDAAQSSEDLPPPTPPPPPPLTDADVAAARAEGYRQGEAEGVSDELRAQTAALALIGDRLATIRQEAAEAADKTALALARMLLDAFIAACPSLRGRFGEPEVFDLVRKIMPGLAREPVVHVRVNAELIDRLRPMFRRYGGKLEFTSCEDMTLGEIEVEWKDGGAQLRSEDVCREISEALYSDEDGPNRLKVVQAQD